MVSRPRKRGLDAAAPQRITDTSATAISGTTANDVATSPNVEVDLKTLGQHDRPSAAPGRAVTAAHRKRLVVACHHATRNHPAQHDSTRPRAPKHDRPAQASAPSAATLPGQQTSPRASRRRPARRTNPQAIPPEHRIRYPSQRAGTHRRSSEARPPLRHQPPRLPSARSGQDSGRVSLIKQQF